MIRLKCFERTGEGAQGASTREDITGSRGSRERVRHPRQGTRAGKGPYPFLWARLIRKVYEGDRLICPKCKVPMRVIALIDDPAVVRRILEHLGRWAPEPSDRERTLFSGI